jgi:hypothetical protein
MNGVMWGLVTIGGPVLLLAFLIWGVLRNRGASAGEVAETERGAVKLREDLQRDPQYRED